MKKNDTKTPETPAQTPPSAQPGQATPQAPAKPKGKTEKPSKLAFAEITAKTPADQIELYRENVVKPFGSLVKAKDAIVDKLHNAMKIVASMKRIYADRLAKREIPPDTTEKKFFEGNGGDVPARVKQLASFFNAVCLTMVNGAALVAENVLDAHSASTLEAAAVIIATERKNLAEGWMNTPTTKALVEALTTAGDATKKLREVRKVQLGTKEEEAVTVTPTQAAAVLLTAIPNVQDDEAGYDLYASCQEIADAWGNTKLQPETVIQWQEKYQKALEKGVAPHVDVKTGSPAPEPTAAK